MSASSIHANSDDNSALLKFTVSLISLWYPACAARAVKPALYVCAAGVGAVLNEAGDCELEASIMDSQLRCGAATLLTHVR